MIGTVRQTNVAVATQIVEHAFGGGHQLGRGVCHSAAELANVSSANELEVAKAQRLAAIESAKFTKLVAAITPETIRAMAAAGPETQAKLLGGLGLKGYVVTDGTSPINLFNTAQGMVGMPPAPPVPPAPSAGNA